MASRRLWNFASSNFLKRAKEKSTKQISTVASLGVSIRLHYRRVAYFSVGFFSSFGVVELLRLGYFDRPKIWTNPSVLFAAEEEGEKPKKVIQTTMSRREKRFNQFASCQYEGQFLMTPQDFLESLTENEPKC